MIPIILLGGTLIANTSGISISGTSGVQILDDRSVSTSVGGNWASLMDGVWYLEEGTTSTRTSSGVCTTSCGLSRVSGGNNDRSTTQVAQGTYSNTFDGTGDYLSCADATCGGFLNGSADGTNGSMTWGCWVFLGGAYTPPVSSTLYVINKIASNAGYALTVTTDNFFGNVLADTANCTVNSTTASQTYNNSNRYTWVNQWQHVACSFNDVSNTLTTYHSGTSQATAAPTSISAGNSDFFLGGSGSLTNFFGYMDECFVYKGTALSAASICRVCSCGLDGSLCTYDPISNVWINKGRNEEFCNLCTLPSTPTTAPAS